MSVRSRYALIFAVCMALFCYQVSVFGAGGGGSLPYNPALTTTRESVIAAGSDIGPIAFVIIGGLGLIHFVSLIWGMLSLLVGLSLVFGFSQYMGSWGYNAAAF